jgi:hypothetical protein
MLSLGHKDGCVTCERIKIIEEMVARIYETIDIINKEIEQESSINIKSLVKFDEATGQITVQTKQMKDNQLHHFLRPILADR